MGSHARMLAALCAVLVLSIAAAASSASAMNVTVRVETNALNLTQPLVPRAAATVTPGGSPVDGCPSDSPVAALRQVLNGTNLVVTPDPSTSTPTIDAIKTVSASAITTAAQVKDPTAVGPTWVVYYGGTPVTNPCSSLTIGGSEVLAYLQCGTGTTAVKPDLTTNPCFTGRPLTIIPTGGNIGDVTPFLTSAPGTVTLKVFRANVPEAPGNANVSTTSDVTTDEDAHFKASTGPDDYGATYVSLTKPGYHQIIATDTVSATVNGKLQQYKMVPDRLPVCATDGHDGYCGTTILTPPPPLTGADPSPCQSNGHDGHCGTVDTSGPPTTVTNIRNKGLYSKRSSPKKLTGTITPDESGVKQVLVRLTRVTTTKVAIKPKKKAKKGSKKKRRIRYRTVKRCTYWDDGSLLFEKAKRCGAKYGKWFPAAVSDVPTDFTYSFEMKLPTGRYVLEVEGYDVDGHPEDVVPGRNLLTFTVK